MMMCILSERILTLHNLHLDKRYILCRVSSLLPDILLTNALLVIHTFANTYKSVVNSTKLQRNANNPVKTLVAAACLGS